MNVWTYTFHTANLSFLWFHTELETMLDAFDGSSMCVFCNVITSATAVNRLVVWIVKYRIRLTIRGPDTLHNSRAPLGSESPKATRCQAPRSRHRRHRGRKRGCTPPQPTRESSERCKLFSRAWGRDFGEIWAWKMHRTIRISAIFEKTIWANVTRGPFPAGAIRTCTVVTG